MSFEQMSQNKIAQNIGELNERLSTYFYVVPISNILQV